MTARPTPVEDLLKLVDACNRCSVAFRAADKHLSDLRFRAFYDRLQRTLDQFIFELEKESSRIGTHQPDPLSMPAISTANTGSLLTYAEGELQSALEGYDACLIRPMPAHARAMVQRQRLSLCQLQADLDEISSAVPLQSSRHREYCSRRPRR